MTEFDSTMSPSAAARVLGLSKTYVLRLADAGVLPCQRTPLGRLLDAEAVRALARTRAANAAVQAA